MAGLLRSHRATGASTTRITAGVAELESGEGPLDRVRRPGAGRKPVAVTDAGLVPALLRLVEPTRRGDPESALCWTTLSTARRGADALTRAGHQVSPDTVAKLLKAEGFGLQANAKTIEGNQHLDRDAQFRYLNKQTEAFLGAGEPVISVDTKKKEFVGAFKNGGPDWRPAGQPERVQVHDFPDPDLGKVIPYGVYDVGATRAGSAWAAITTRPRSRWQACAAGGRGSAAPPIPTPPNC